MALGLLLRSEPASVSVVRRELTADLRRLGLADDSVADVVLVASELVGNAVLHGGGDDLGVSWRLGRDHVTVRVSDRNPERPQPRAAAPDAARGRGLVIVAALAADWGVRATDRGKQVWARVPMHRA